VNRALSQERSSSLSRAFHNPLDTYAHKVYYSRSSCL
jgi:hypothetical protein